MGRHFLQFSAADFCYLLAISAGVVVSINTSREAMLYPYLPSRPASSPCRCRWLAWLLLPLLPGVARAEDSTSAKPSSLRSPWSANLWLTQEYRYRTAGAPTVATPSPLGEAPAQQPKTDQDLRLTLDGTFLGLGEHAVGTVSAAFWRDMDGQVPRGDPALFGDLQGLAQPLFVLYALSAEWRRSTPLERLALGRQQAAHGLPVTFDGGSVDLRFWQRRLSCFAYGGRTVHFFEADPGFLEDWLVGGGAGLRLTQHLQLEVDSRYLHETVLAAGGEPGNPVATNSYGLSLTGRWDELSGKLFARGMNHRFSHLGGVFHLLLPRAGLGVDGQTTVQLVPLGEIAESESPYYSMLGNSLPHLRARLETWKDFRLGEKAAVTLAAGTRLRQLLYDQPVRFNRNMSALYLRGDLNDLPWQGVFASVMAEWNLPGQASDSSRFFTVGGTAGYRSRRLRGEVGTYFQRFKINYYRDVEELTDARTVYTMAALRVLPQLELRGRYVLEIVDRSIHTAYLTLREDF
jgi:hypothetical protein